MKWLLLVVLWLPPAGESLNPTPHAVTTAEFDSQIACIQGGVAIRAMSEGPFQSSRPGPRYLRFQCVRK